jgi:hypothetical protein
MCECCGDYVVYVCVIQEHCLMSYGYSCSIYLLHLRLLPHHAVLCLLSRSLCCECVYCPAHQLNEDYDKSVLNHNHANSCR